MQPLFTLTRKERIKRKKEFSDIYTAGKQYNSQNLRLYFKQPDSSSGEPSKIGIVASRKVGSAPRRNYLKRSIREAYRKNKQRLKNPVRIVIVLKPGTKPVSGMAIQQEFLDLCQKARLI